MAAISKKIKNNLTWAFSRYGTHLASIFLFYRKLNSVQEKISILMCCNGQFIEVYLILRLSLLFYLCLLNIWIYMVTCTLCIQILQYIYIYVLVYILNTFVVTLLLYIYVRLKFSSYIIFSINICTCVQVRILYITFGIVIFISFIKIHWCLFYLGFIFMFRFLLLIKFN